MGHIRHNAIVVTCWDPKRLDKAHQKAKMLQLPVSSKTKGVANGYSSFLIAPDGSKSGWGDSDQGDVLRQDFKEWLIKQRHSDRSSSYEWAEIEYGSDDGYARVVASEWTPGA